MARTKTLNPAADLRRDPAADFKTTKTLQEKPNYARINIFVAEDKRQAYEDFKIYCKDQMLSVSELLCILMAREVEQHAAEIEAAKIRQETAHKRYGK